MSLQIQILCAQSGLNWDTICHFRLPCYKDGYKTMHLINNCYRIPRQRYFRSVERGTASLFSYNENGCRSCNHRWTGASNSQNRTVAEVIRDVGSVVAARETLDTGSLRDMRAALSVLETIALRADSQESSQFDDSASLRDALAHKIDSYLDNVDWTTWAERLSVLAAYSRAPVPATIVVNNQQYGGIKAVEAEFVRWATTPPELFTPSDGYHALHAHWATKARITGRTMLVGVPASTRAKDSDVLAHLFWDVTDFLVVPQEVAQYLVQVGRPTGREVVTVPCASHTAVAIARSLAEKLSLSDTVATAAAAAE